MPVQHTPGKGQHTLVRIEHMRPDEARIVVEFEDSAPDAQSDSAGPAWCFRWAMNCLYQGSHYECAIQMAEALWTIEANGEGMNYAEEEEMRLIAAMLYAGTRLHEYRIRKHWERNAADGQAKTP